METVIVVWFANLVSIPISAALDRAPTHTQHGGPYVAFCLLFMLPLGMVYGTLATGLPWWVVAMAQAASLALAVIFSAAKKVA
jgi:hypothetical protein